MTTWTFKGPAAALAFVALTGCETGQGGPSKPPLSRASMTGGITVVAPSGFCIDQDSLGPRFAVMARCDGLGVTGAAGAAPRGLITVSLMARATGPLPTASQIAAASALQNVDNVDQRETQVTFRAQGRIPVDGLAPTQWRGVARIGGQTVGMAVYGPQNGEIVTSTGRGILFQLIDRSIQATGQVVRPAVKRN